MTTPNKAPFRPQTELYHLLMLNTTSAPLSEGQGTRTLPLQYSTYSTQQTRAQAGFLLVFVLLSQGVPLRESTHCCNAAVLVVLSGDYVLQW